MASNIKKNNQYYGKYRECCVVACLNDSPVEYFEKYIFSQEEKDDLYQDGKIIADYLGDHKATYSGNHTATAAGDIILDNGETIELKCISAGTGTYFNTSIYYFQKFGFNFKDYMEKYGFYQLLENNFGKIFKINRKNNSPISQPNSSAIRHNYIDIYNEIIVPADKRIREYFVKDLVKYFMTHTDKMYEFINDMLNKKTDTCDKGSPDRLIIYNYSKKKIKEINLRDFFKDGEIIITDKGFKIGNVRFAIGWQNGNGLNNPTIRVFLED